MEREQIVRMAREAGLEWDLIDEDEGRIWYITAESLEAFFHAAYAAGAAAEREACAYRAGIALLGADRGLANRVDQSIRARSAK